MKMCIIGSARYVLLPAASTMAASYERSWEAEPRGEIYQDERHAPEKYAQVIARREKPVLKSSMNEPCQRDHRNRYGGMEWIRCIEHPQTGAGYFNHQVYRQRNEGSHAKNAHPSQNRQVAAAILRARSFCGRERGKMVARIQSIVRGTKARSKPEMLPDAFQCILPGAFARRKYSQVRIFVLVDDRGS